MKRLKSALLVFIASVLAVSITIGSIGVFTFASAATFTGSFFQGTVTTRVKEGGDFTVPTPLTGVSVEVYTPAGRMAKVKPETTYTYVAEQLGNYKVSYIADDQKNKYTYNVYCYEDRAYYVDVMEEKDSFIPSYMDVMATTDEGRPLPEFKLAYKNAKGEVVEYATTDTGANRTRGIRVSAPEIASVVGDKLKTHAAGTVTLTFWAKLGASTTKEYTKDYVIKVQKDLGDTTPPNLGSISMSGTANINTLYTLPQATAEDLYETNVYIDVQVVGPGESEVLDYKANADGYADKSDEALPTTPVVLRNNGNRSFFVTEAGRYQVTYTAIDGSGNESTAHEYEIRVTDGLAPKITELSTDLIPTKWGYDNVSKGKIANEGEDPTADPRGDKSFRLPFPTAVDNLDKEKDLVLTVTIKNPQRTIASWEGTIQDYRDGKVEVTSATQNKFFKTDNKNMVFQPEANVESPNYNTVGFSFGWIDFKGEDTGNSGSAIAGKDSEKYGDWTFTYAVSDKAGNGGSSTASSRIVTTLNLAANFSDIYRPEIDTNNLDLPERILITGEDDSFTVPAIPLKSDDDIRLTTNYTMSVDVDFEDDFTVEKDGIVYTVIDEHDVNGGEVYAIHEIEYVEDDTDPEDIITAKRYFMLIQDGNKDLAMMLPAAGIGEVITLDFDATDDVGNHSKAWSEDIDILFASSATPGAGLALAESSTILKTITDVKTNTTVAADAIKQKQTINVGGFTVPNIVYNKYTGFEVSIMDDDNQPVAFSLYTYTRKTDAANPDDVRYTIHVEDIELTTKNVGDYKINVRIYDISGKSVVYGYSFNVNPSSSGNHTVESATKVESQGTIRTEYDLERSYPVDVDPAEDECVIVRRIEGYSFGLVRNTFVGLEASMYSISDYVIEGYAEGNWAANKAAMDASGSRRDYSVELKNKDVPIIEIQGSVPKNYAAKLSGSNPTGSKYVYSGDDYVFLPVFTGFTKFETADITVEVTRNNVIVSDFFKVYETNDAIPVRTFEEKEENGDENEFTGAYAFVADTIGNYVVNVTAKSSSGTNTAQYTIRVGDTTPASFRLPSKTMTSTVGSKFKRPLPTITDDFTSITISLKDTTGKVIPEASITIESSKFNSTSTDYTNTDYTFKDAGKYTVVYTVTNENGNESIDFITLEVSGASSGNSTAPAALTAALIIIGVLLIAGVVVYVVRFRAVKK